MFRPARAGGMTNPSTRPGQLQTAWAQLVGHTKGDEVLPVVQEASTVIQREFPRRVLDFLER
jgi:hypothetical protein